MPWGSKELDLVRQQIAALHEVVRHLRRSGSEGELANALLTLDQLKAKREQLRRNKTRFKRRETSLSTLTR